MLLTLKQSETKARKRPKSLDGNGNLLPPRGVKLESGAPTSKAAEVAGGTVSGSALEVPGLEVEMKPAVPAVPVAPIKSEPISSVTKGTAVMKPKPDDSTTPMDVAEPVRTPVGVELPASGNAIADTTKKPAALDPCQAPVPGASASLLAAEDGTPKASSGSETPAATSGAQSEKVEATAPAAPVPDADGRGTGGSSCVDASRDQSSPSVSSATKSGDAALEERTDALLKKGTGDARAQAAAGAGAVDAKAHSKAGGGTDKKDDPMDVDRDRAVGVASDVGAEAAGDAASGSAASDKIDVRFTLLYFLFFFLRGGVGWGVAAVSDLSTTTAAVRV